MVHRVALALLKSVQLQLMATDFEGAMNIFRDIPKHFDSDEIMKDAFKFNLKQVQISAIAGPSAL